MVKEYTIPCKPKKILSGKELKIAQLEWKIRFHEEKIKEAKKEINKLKGVDKND